MKALLVLTHGTRNNEMNDSYVASIHIIAKKLQGKFDVIEPCFLEFAQPDFLSTLRKIYEQGARRFYVYPYFLSGGKHVTKDIPGIVEDFQIENKNCTVKVLPAFGKYPEVMDLLTKALQEISC